MQWTISKVCLAFAGVVILSSAPAQAQVVIVDNLTQPNEGVDSLGVFAAAQQFTTDGTARQLSSVTLALIGNPGDSLTVTLDSDAGGIPGSDLLNLGTAVPTSNAAFTDITLVPATPFTLAANTSYWIAGQYNGTPGWGFTGDGFSPGSNDSSGVGSLGDYSEFNFGWVSDPLSPYLIEVQATPEPGASALAAGFFLTGAVFLRRRRFKAQ